jgi:hypothetical protein
MRIEVKEKDRNFYDEVLYIYYSFKRVLKKPNKKVVPATKWYLRGFISYFLFAILFVFMGINDGFDKMTVVFMYLFFIFSGVMIYNMFIINKLLNNYMNDGNNDSVFEINEDVIRLENKNGTMELKWDLVKYILINKETISFVPGKVGISSICMFISTKYKEDVMNAIKKYKKEELVVDNSCLYK